MKNIQNLTAIIERKLTEYNSLILLNKAFNMSENPINRITIDPEVCHGKPSIRGLRYPVDSIVEYLAAGDTIEDILNEFPVLEREDILACVAYASASIS